MVGYFAGAVGTWLTHSPQYTNILRWLTGGTLIGLGLRLALTDQQ
jgi:threonine/homoserine/homoserine lactone efflux protein